MPGKVSPWAWHQLPGQPLPEGAGPKSPSTGAGRRSWQPPGPDLGRPPVPGPPITGIGAGDRYPGGPGESACSALPGRLAPGGWGPAAGAPHLLAPAVMARAPGVQEPACTRPLSGGRARSGSASGAGAGRCTACTGGCGPQARVLVLSIRAAAHSSAGLQARTSSVRDQAASLCFRSSPAPHSLGARLACAASAARPRILARSIGAAAARARQACWRCTALSTLVHRACRCSCPCPRVRLQVPQRPLSLTAACACRRQPATGRLAGSRHRPLQSRATGPTAAGDQETAPVSC